MKKEIDSKDMFKITLFTQKQMADMLNISTKKLKELNKKGVLIPKKTSTGRSFYTEEQYLFFVNNKEDFYE